MIQNVIVYIIIAATLAYVIFSIVKNLKTKKAGHCGGCDGCSVKNEFQKKIVAGINRKQISVGSS
ncbi:MAG: FeoB-associated Cys-rich membrane protein [Mariniphaga sp.]|nr:FeoB-associated Cys-rich membrane protein [Mariniphaga sp.]